MPRPRKPRKGREAATEISTVGKSKLKLPEEVPITCLDDIYVLYRWMQQQLRANKRIPAVPPGQPACVRIDGNHDPDNPDKMNEYRAAIYLKIAMAHASRCSDNACRRLGMCRRPLADAYDWDNGWWFSKRKETHYGVTREADWLGTITAGPNHVEKAIAEKRELAKGLNIREAPRPKV
jgi:hypothetical protein